MSSVAAGTSTVDNVAVRGAAVSEVTRARKASAVAEEPPPPLSNTRAASMQRYLSAQTNVDQEVLQLYKLVCRGPAVAR